jgi:hypothetical protein
VQEIYYATRIGRLKAHRKGSAWVVDINDLKGYKESLARNPEEQAS